MQMSFKKYDELFSKYENRNLDVIGYSFTEDDFQIVQNAKDPEEFVTYLIFLSTKPMPKSDKNRVEKVLYNLLTLVDDDMEDDDNAEL